MDIALMCRELPTKGPDSVHRYTLKKHLDLLGGERTVFKRVSASMAPDLVAEIITPEIREEYETAKRGRWVTECHCSVCGEYYYTGWFSGPVMKGICLMVGEDGLTYPCMSDDAYDPAYGTYVEVGPNDGFLCPCCSTVTHLSHASALRGGRTWRLLMMSVNNVGIYTTIFYWLVSRTIDEDGCVFSSIRPWNAYVIDEAQRVQRFIYKDGEGWRWSRSKGDAYYSLYPSMDGGMYNYRMNGWACDQVPDLTGCTGEKTGLAAYVMAGGQLPLLYMKSWRRHPAMENLVVSGWTALVAHDLEEESAKKEIPYALFPNINWGSSKPHEMLRMDKQSFRELSRKHPRGWQATEYEAWLNYQASGGQCNALEFDEYFGKFKLEGVNIVLGLRGMSWAVDFPKIERYLTKQGLRCSDAHMISDTWRMTMQMFGRRELTSEEMFPRDLFAAHERLSRMVRLEKNKDGWTKFLAGFQAVREKYRELEWTDGDLCIVLPKDNGDLIREGDILRHCVHGYGAEHVSGEQTIFFVRHYRRPERCYYTLSIDMRGKPKRKQLHGYGNERHGPHKEYRHSIPQKVLDFVARWEREVLGAWYREQLRKEAAKAASSKNNRKELKSA